MIRIITDSAADFEPQELEQLHITCIPLSVHFGEADYQENVNLAKTQFYELLLHSEEPPKTSRLHPRPFWTSLKMRSRMGRKSFISPCPPPSAALIRAL